MANITTEQMLGNMRDKISQTFARQNGFYETMGVGTAVNLAGQQDCSNPDKFRTSGGTEDIATGTARLEGIKGNAVAWNQLVQNGDFSQGTNNWDFRTPSAVTVSDGVLIITAPDWFATCLGQTTNLTNNHKYLVKIVAKCSNNNNLSVALGTPWGLNSASYVNISLTTEYEEYKVIINKNKEGYDLFFRCSVIDSTTTFWYKSIMLFDLTIIYGEGKEPSTPEQFEADYKRWFGKALTYEDYDAGTLKPVLMTGYKTVGFNLLDPTTGKAHLVGTYGNTNVAQGLYCYEITGNYTAITDEDGNAITPVNGFFMVENPQEITVTGADENTCIHLTWSGWRNSESEAYWSDLSPIPVTTLTGKLNGEGTSVTMFADGMKKVGSTYDELKVEYSLTKAIKRIGSRAYQEGDVSSDTMLTDGRTTTYYILATPEEYILDNFELPIRFKVDDFGTEEQVGEGVAAILILKYGVNAVDVLRRLPQNYISVESMDNFLAQLGVAMNGTWTKTWNESNQEYDFTFVPNSEPTPENTTNQEEA